MADDDILRTWADVDRRLEGSPRGTRSALARYLNMSSTLLSRNLNDGDGELTVTRAKAIADFLLGVPESHGASATPAPGTRTLTTYGYANPVNRDQFALHEGSELEPTPLPSWLHLDPKDHFAVTFPGSSMEPRVFAGELLIVKRNLPPGRDKLAVVEFMDNWATLLDYKAFRAGRLFGEIFNPHQAVDFEATKVRAVHAVILTL